MRIRTREMQQLPPHTDASQSGASAGTLQVPVTKQGQAPVMCFDPKYLANALDFGVTLRSGGKLHLGMAGDPRGEFCLLMSRRDSGWLLGVCFLQEAPERAIGTDRRAGKWGLP